MPKASADFSPAAAISGKRGDQCITDQGAGTDVVTVFLRIAPRDGGLHRWGLAGNKKKWCSNKTKKGFHQIWEKSILD